MELRCTEEYALFISQGVIEAYLKLFMDKIRQRTDSNDLDFTDYEVKLNRIYCFSLRIILYFLLENSI